MNTKKTTISAGDLLERKYGPMSLGRYIKGHRDSENLSQADLASKLKISRANLCDIEKERKLVSPERAARFAKVLKIPETLFIKLALNDILRESKLKYSVELKSLAA